MEYGVWNSICTIEMENIAHEMESDLHSNIYRTTEVKQTNDVKGLQSTT